MKIVILGGTGLIGSKLAERLREQGHEVIAASPRTGVNAVTGEGLQDALTAADVVVDVSNSPSFETEAVRAFFETSTRNVLAAEAAQSVGHHVALSIVGADRLPDTGYMRAKVLQENLIKSSGVPYTILRATQFFEFLDAIAASCVVGDELHVSTGAFQPVAADDVAATLAVIAVGPPVNGTRELAGPQRSTMAEIVRQALSAVDDTRPVIADPAATYFGAPLKSDELVPLGEAHIGRITLEQWRKQPALAATERSV